MIDATEPHYDWLYSELGDIWGDAPGRLVADLAATCRPGRALDVGCGSGKNSAWLAQAGWQVEAFDVSALAVGLAKRKLSATTVHLERCDLRERYYAHDHYDTIVLYGVAHCLSDRELTAFADAARSALKTNGKLLIASFTPDIAPPDGHFRRPVYARTASELLGIFGCPPVDYMEVGEIEEDHGGLVNRHRHSMCWMSLRYP